MTVKGAYYCHTRLLKKLFTNPPTDKALDYPLGLRNTSVFSSYARKYKPLDYFLAKFQQCLPAFPYFLSRKKSRCGAFFEQS